MDKKKRAQGLPSLARGTRGRKRDCGSSEEGGYYEVKSCSVDIKCY